jgi:uncharacterized membrane protein HdeD (DUF308 family)
MVDYAATTWKTAVLRGLVSIAAGALLVAWPQLVLNLGLTIYGAYSIALGVVDGGALLFQQQVVRKGWLLVLAALNIVVGLLLVTRTQQTAAVVLAIVGIVLVIQGLASFVALMRRDRTRLEAWVLGAAAVCEVLIGVVFIFEPWLAGVGFVAILGALVLVYGVVSVGAGLASRASQDSSGSGPMRPA